MLGLVSWNVRYFSHRTRGITSTQFNLHQIAQELAGMETQPHLIALQEIDDFSVRSAVGRIRSRQRLGQSHSQLDRFVEQLNLQSSRKGGRTYRSVFFPAHGHNKTYPLISTGLAVLYSSDLQLWDHNGNQPFHITHYRHPSMYGVKQTRICGWCRFRTSDQQEFDVYNTHLSLPAFLGRAKKPTGGRFGEANNQLFEVNKVIECIKERGGIERSLLVGDFNARPGSRVYNQIIGNMAYRDAHADYLGLGAHQMSQMPSAGFMAMRFRLDHVFSGAGIRFTDFSNTHPYGADHPWGALSDHSPIIGNFDLA